MVSIARKNLFAEKTRFFVSVGGVAFSILLIVFLLGIYNAFNRLLIDYVESFAADLVIAQEGVTDMSHTFSLLDANKMSQVETISGGKVYGLVNRTTNVRVREEDGSKIVDFAGRKKGENKKAKKAEHEYLVLTLKYQNNHGVLSGVKIVSRPSRRMYVKAKDIKSVRSGYGLAIISTSKGIMSSKEAKKSGLGGEIICEVW